MNFIKNILKTLIIALSTGGLLIGLFCWMMMTCIRFNVENGRWSVIIVFAIIIAASIIPVKLVEAFKNRSGRKRRR